MASMCPSPARAAAYDMHNTSTAAPDPGKRVRSVCLRLLLPLLCALVMPQLSAQPAAAAGSVQAAEAAEAAAPAAVQALSTKQQRLVPIAAFCAMGAEDKLKTALHAGLNAGLTISEVREVLVQMYAYAGFPRSLTGLNVLLSVLDERKARGITDVAGADATPLPASADIRALGTANQTAIIGRPASGRIYEFAPVIDTFLKEHLFGDIFCRDVLTFQERELATVSALAALPAPAQLRSHLRCCLVVGISASQLHDVVQVLATSVGEKEADLARTSLDAVLKAWQAQDGTQDKQAGRS